MFQNRFAVGQRLMGLCILRPGADPVPKPAVLDSQPVLERLDIEAVSDWCHATSGLTLAALAATSLPQSTQLQSGDRVLVCGAGQHWRTAALIAVADAAGAEVLLLERFCAVTALRLLDTEQITVSDWLPWQLGAVLDLPAEIRRQYNGHAHRQAWTGGARIPDPYKHRLIAWWGEVLYEHFTGLGWPGHCLIDSADWLARPGSVGCWVPSASSTASATVALDEAGEARLPGQIGRLAITVSGTLLQPTEQAGYVDEDGWVHPLGPLNNRLEFAFGRDERGFVGPAEAERWLETHPAVAEVALLAIAAGLAEPLGLAACFYAVVQLKPDAPTETPLLELELLDFSRLGLSEIKCPAGVLFVAALPRLIDGQIDLAALNLLVAQSVAVVPPLPLQTALTPPK